MQGVYGTECNEYIIDAQFVRAKGEGYHCRIKLLYRCSTEMLICFYLVDTLIVPASRKMPVSGANSCMKEEKQNVVVTSPPYVSSFQSPLSAECVSQV